MTNMVIDVIAQQGNFLTSPTDDINDYVFKKNCKLGKSVGHSNMGNTVLRLGKKQPQIKSKVLLKL